MRYMLHLAWDKMFYTCVQILFQPHTGFVGQALPPPYDPSHTNTSDSKALGNFTSSESTYVTSYIWLGYFVNGEPLANPLKVWVHLQQG